MISFEAKGSFKRTEEFLRGAQRVDISAVLHRYGRAGVMVLAANTPVDTGLTAASWGYEIIREPGVHRLIFTNSSMAGNTPVAILLQYGHATGEGGYVEGTDFINPALKPIFKELAFRAWKEVTRK